MLVSRTMAHLLFYIYVLEFVQEPYTLELQKVRFPDNTRQANWPASTYEVSDTNLCCSEPLFII